MDEREIKKAFREMGEAFEDYKETNDKVLAKLQKGQGGTGELEEKLGKIDDLFTKTQKALKDDQVEREALKERIEELEARQKQPGFNDSQKRNAKYAEHFGSFIRHRGSSADDEKQMTVLAQQAFEAKDVTIGVPAAGGYALPEQIARDVEKLERKLSPIRDLVKVVQVGTSDYKELVTTKHPTSGWVGETSTRSATTTPRMRERAPTHGELYAYPQVSEWSLDDLFFNVEEWLTTELADAFAYEESLAVFSGNATNKPRGMTNGAPVSTADTASPLRSGDVYQFVASTDPASPGTPQVFADALITLVYTLNTKYRSGAKFAMNSLTTGAVRKLKDSQNQYLWAPGLQAGEPDRLLGYPVFTWEQMSDVGANLHPIAFGDFRKAYVMTDRVGTRITRDNVTNIGFVKFYVRRRVGGTPLNNDALKFLKTIA
jgi:HK97 family phage major capsid protein